MKEQELINCGFKKETTDSDYWFVYKYKNHEFISNDTIANQNKDNWFLGYRNTRENEDIFWFNQNLSKIGSFKTIFHVLAGIDFKLANQKKKLSHERRSIRTGGA